MDHIYLLFHIPKDLPIKVIIYSFRDQYLVEHHIVNNKFEHC